jgi:hypothetical protein
MSGPENFLARWARRKRAVAEESAQADKPISHDTPAPEEGDAPASPAQAKAPAAPEFDVSSLPPIETIGADTDIAAFLKPGVPAALRHAALRRVWVTDPAIRDFKGLQDYDWDFNSPDLPGFGPIRPEHDVGRMVARVFGDKLPEDAVGEPTPAEANSPQPVPPPHESAEAPTISPGEKTPATAMQQLVSAAPEPELLQREVNIAAQQEKPIEEKDQKNVRRHGGALPH